MELNEASYKLKLETSGGGNKEEALKETNAGLRRLARRAGPFEPVDCGTVLGVVPWSLRTGDREK